MTQPSRQSSMPGPDALPVLPLRDTVVYPATVVPILIGQERSVRLVSDALAVNRLVALVAQRTNEVKSAQPGDLYRLGTLARVHDVVRVQDSGLRVAVQGLERVRVHQYVQTEPYLVARIERAPDVTETGLEADALARTARELFVRMVSLDAELPDELVTAVQAVSDPRSITYLLASSTPLPTAVRQELLEIDSIPDKLRRLIEILQHEVAVRQLMQKITADTSAQMSKAQREHILRKHMEAIQRELGETDPEQAEARELRDRLRRAELSGEAKKEAERELDRLERIPAISPEHGIIRTYLDWLLKLPWNKVTGAPIDVSLARRVLDEDHYDLDRIKDRIVEYLAVKRLRELRQDELADAAPAPDAAAAPAPPPTPPGSAARGEPILCFIGPPGVGKTSLGQSIARALGRSFARVSLGGIHDEAEIRGHRRTYIGAMPGRIVQAVARAEAADPVFMLDEVDKLGVGFHGDPSAALLEVLDPAQNHAFVDSYLGVAFDLSRVLFICTANTAETIPPPLLDRMEVLALPGYTDAEKLHIAVRFLLPKQLAANGLREGEAILGERVIGRIVREYTREAGVRNLERELATVLRKVARRVGEGASTPIGVEERELADYLGPQRFFDDVAERIDRPGVATGLSWTPAGGDILFVEATMMPGEEEKLVLTGMLGNVMRESAQAALSYLRSNAERLGIDPQAFTRKIVHVHVPVGAIPKDGPSAGVTILAALASIATGRPVRNDLAMTGEITLRGKVLPVGGIKEKVLAAHRAGIGRILMPRRNEGALQDVPDEVRRECEVVFCESLDEVVEQALVAPEAPEVRAHEALPASPPPVH